MIRRLLAARDVSKEGIARAFSRVHFVGIGGAGMSAVARLALEAGLAVLVVDGTLLGVGQDFVGV